LRTAEYALQYGWDMGCWWCCWGGSGWGCGGDGVGVEFGGFEMRNGTPGKSKSTRRK